MSNGSTATADHLDTAKVEVRKPRRVPLSLVIGGGIVAFFVLLAIVGPYITPYPFDQFHFKHRMVGPSEEFWLGTDRYGRDIFSRVVAGARLTVFMAGTGTLFGVLVGVLIGMFSGYTGGWVDEILMRCTDIAMSFPGLLLAMLVVAALGANEVNAVISIGIVFVPKVARVVRSATLGLRHVQFVEAAQVRGESRRFIIFKRDPAQHLAADHRRELHPPQLRGAARGLAELPRPRRPAAGSRLGPDDRQGTGLHGHRAVGGVRPGRGHRRPDHLRQPAGRRHARVAGGAENVG